MTAEMLMRDARVAKGWAAFTQTATYINPAITDAAARIVSKDRIDFRDAVKQAEREFGEAYAREECANGRANEYDDRGFLVE